MIRRSKSQIDSDEEEEYDLDDEDSMKRSFNNSLEENFDKLGFPQFNELVKKLKLNPRKTQAKVISARHAGCRKIYQCFNENPCIRSNRNSRALEKLKYECDMSLEIRDEFENYFKKTGETKLDLYEFYKIVERSEVDVEQSCMILNNQHYTRRWQRILFKSFCQNQRTKQSAKHVDTFDQIESEKH